MHAPFWGAPSWGAHHFGAIAHHFGAGARPAAPVPNLVQILEGAGREQVYSVRATVSSVNLTVAWPTTKNLIL